MRRSIMAAIAGLFAFFIGQSSHSAIAAEGWDGVSEAAKSEGTVVWYTSHVPALSTKLAESFTSKYGIDVEIIRLTSGPLVQRYLAEEAAQTYAADVITASSPAFFVKAKADGMFADLSKDGSPSASSWPATAWDGITAVVAVSPVYMAYNKDLVSAADVPTKWSDLADPKWKSKVIIPDPRLTPTWLLMAYRWQQAYGSDFLKALAGSDFQLAESVLPATQSLAAGEKSILAMTLSGVAQPLIDKGAPIALAPIDPTTGLEQLAAVSVHAPHPNSARLFMDYLMSVEGQSTFNRNNSASVLPAVPDTVSLPQGYEQPDYVAAEKGKASVLKDLGLSE